MKKYSSLFILWFSITNLFAQSLADSLKNALKNAKTDTAKVSIYAQLTTAGIHIIPQPEIVEYSLKGYALAKSISYEKGQIACGFNAGFSLAKTDSYKSLIIFFDVKKLCEQNNDTLNLIRSVGYIGYAYNHFNISKSLHYYKLCLQMMQKNNLSEDFIPIYTSIGFAYKDGGMPDSALFYLQKGYQYALKGLSPANPKEYHRDFGEIYYKKGNNDSAMYHFRRSIIALGNNPSGQTYMGIARIMRDKNQIDSAKVYAKEGLKIFQKNNYNYFIIDCAQLLYDLYKDTDAIEAQKYRLIVLETKDKLYDQDKAKQVEKLAFEELEREMELQIRLKDIKNRNRFYALLGILGGVLLLSFILYRNNRQKQKANKILENTLADLKTTQAQLIQSEKLASLGELTAGIAHEIQNPLNFVNNFAEVSAEMLDEMHEELEKGDTTEAIAIATALKTNLQKINHHGQRASSIVKGMLEHSRASTGVKEPTDLNALADEYLRLAYHGLRAKDDSFNAALETHFDPDLPLVSVIPQDIGRVLLNLINNAFYAVNEKAKMGIEGYQPTVTVSSSMVGDKVEIRVQDNGKGIPESIKEKIFQPFFTTKPTGQGTGLGLSLAYDIVTKGHGGTLKVQSTENEGTEFIINLPALA